MSFRATEDRIVAGVANYLTEDFINSAKIDTVDLSHRVAISSTWHTFVGGEPHRRIIKTCFLKALVAAGLDSSAVMRR